LQALRGAQLRWISLKAVLDVGASSTFYVDVECFHRRRIYQVTFNKV